MRWTWLQPRFGLRTLLAVVLVSALAIAWWTSAGRWRSYNNLRARQRIDPYELKIAGDGDRYNVPTELVAILGDSRLRHWDRTGGMRLLPNNQGISTGGDEIVRIWNIDTGRQTHQFPGETLCLNQKRDRVFIGAPDGMITCFDTTSWKPLKSIRLDTSFDRLSLAASGDGSVLVTQPIQANGQREIIVWNVATTTVKHRFHVQSFGGSLLVNNDGSLFAWDDNCEVKVSRTDNGEVLRTIGPVMLQDSRCTVGQLALTPDETKLIFGSASMHLKVFDWLTGEEVFTFPEGASGHSPFVLRADRKRIAIQEGEGVRFYFDTNGSWRAGGVQFGPVPLNSGLDWFDEEFSVAGQDHMRLWSGSIGGIRPRRLRGGPIRKATHLAFHPDGNRLFVADTLGQITGYQVGTWESLHAWQAHEGAIIGLSLAGDGSRLATSSLDGISVWETNSSAEVCTVRDIRHSEYVGVSPDGSHLATPIKQGLGQGIEIWEIATGKSVSTISVNGRIWSSPVWNSDGTHLVCSDLGSTLHLFDVKSKTTATLSGSRFSQLHLQAAWFNDNKRLVTVGWGRDEIHFLEIGKTKPIKTIHAGAGSLKCLALDRKNECLAVAGYKSPVQLWHLPTGTLLKSWQIGPTQGLVSQVAFSPDGHYLATVNGNGTAYILNLDGMLP
jgi:WD40 repeat protein